MEDKKSKAEKTNDETDLNQNPKKHRGLKRWQWVAFILILFDLAAGIGAYFLALWFRFDCRFTEIPKENLYAWFKFIPVYAAANIIVLWSFKALSEHLEICELYGT